MKATTFMRGALLSFLGLCLIVVSLVLYKPVLAAEECRSSFCGIVYEDDEEREKDKDKKEKCGNDICETAESVFGICPEDCGE